MEIQDMLLDPNPYSRTGEEQGEIQYIVVHWVGNANTSAKANRDYFNNLPYINAESIKKRIRPDLRIKPLCNRIARRNNKMYSR